MILQKGDIVEKEEALVLLLGRLHFDTYTKVRIFHIIKNGVDWYEFLNICIRKKLICLAYKNLVDFEFIHLLPSIIKNNMQYHYEENCKQNNLFVKATAPIISYFEQNNLVATSVKGIRFLNTLYANEPGVRILSDIDFVALPDYRFDIHNFMLKSGFQTYLINDLDALCAFNLPIQSYFYIKVGDKELSNKLRIDFDYSYSMEWIKGIKENPLYEFIYLCKNYFIKMHSKTNPDSISQYDYMKLIDLHEYYIKYLTLKSVDDINKMAVQLHLKDEVQYTINCLKTLYSDIGL